MNTGSHMSGLTSGKVSNEYGIKPRQNGDVQMVNSRGCPSSRTNSNERLRMRQQMQAIIFSFLQKRQPASCDNAKRAKLMDVAKRLEEVLYKTAPSQEAYLDPQTLEPRLRNIIKHYNQRRAASSSSVTTMISTPGMPRGGNPSMATSTVDRPAISSCHIATTGSLLPTSDVNGNFSSKSDDQLASPGTLESSGFPCGSLLKASSSNPPRMASQMIPTPGFNNNDCNVNCQSHMNMTTSSSAAGDSAVDYPLTPPSQHKTHHTAMENSRIMHKKQMGNGFRSDLQQSSHSSRIDSHPRGLGTTKDNVQPANEFRDSISFASTTNLQNSTETVGQIPENRLLGEGNFLTNPNPYGFGDTQSINSVRLKSISSASSSAISNQTFSHEMQQVSQMKPQSANQLKNESIPQTHQPHQFPVKTHQFENQQQNQQCQNEKSQQQPPLLNENAYPQPQLASSEATQVKFESGLKHQSEVLWSHTSKHFQPHELQNQVQQSSDEGNCGGSLQASSWVGRHQICPSPPLQSHPMEPMIHRRPLPLESATIVVANLLVWNLKKFRVSNIYKHKTCLVY